VAQSGPLVGRTVDRIVGMGWLDNWSKGRELKKAKAEVLKARSPLSISHFIDKAIELDALEEAREEIDKAKREFPNSRALSEAENKLTKLQAKDELRGHRQELSKSPTGVTYYRLAELYRDCGDYDKTIEFARKGTVRHPAFEGNYIILGEIRYDRFKRDLRAADGRQAIELFEKASDLNRENYRLLKQLAELYLAIGARDDAISKLNEILAFAPDDATALKLLDQAHRMQPQKKGGIKGILDEFERRAELHAKLKSQGMGPRGQRYLRNPAHLANKLQMLPSRVPGIRKIVVLSPQGKLLTSWPEDKEKEATNCETFNDFFEAAMDCSLRMDISTFENALFEGPSGITYLLVIDRLPMAIFCGKETKQQRLTTEVYKFCEHDLYL